MLHCGRFGRSSLNVARREGLRTGQRRGELREVEYRRFALDAQRGGVVRPGRHLRGVVSAEPNARFLSGLADFGHPLAPATLPDSPVNWVLFVVGAGGSELVRDRVWQGLSRPR